MVSMVIQKGMLEFAYTLEHPPVSGVFMEFSGDVVSRDSST